MPFARLFPYATSPLRDIHLRDILDARHFGCATSQLREISIERTSHLRDIPSARHPICATSHLRNFFSLRFCPRVVSLGYDRSRSGYVRLGYTTYIIDSVRLNLGYVKLNPLI